MPLPGDVAQYPIARHSLLKKKGRLKPRRWAYNVSRLEPPWNTLGKPHLMFPFWEGVGTSYRDYSGFQRVNTVAGGGPTWVNGELGPCLDFDGVDDYIEITGMTGVAFPTEWTLMFWFRQLPTDMTGTSTQYMFAHGVTQTVNSVAVYFRENQNASGAGGISCNCVDSNDTTTPTLTAPAGYADGLWHVLTLTADPRQSFRGYVDGVSKLTGAAGKGTGTFTPTVAMRFGVPSTATDRRFKGQLACVVIFSRSISQSLMQDIAADPWCWLRPKSGLLVGYTPPDTGGGPDQFLPEELGPMPYSVY